jgi:putative ABC transport system permease protein
MQSVRKDLRFTLRALTKNPGYAILAVLALALGIGANTAIFSVVYSLMFRPLQGATNPNELVTMLLKEEADYPYSHSYQAYEDYRAGLKSVFVDAVGSTGASAQMRVGNDAAERIFLTIVTGNYFEMLGVNMYKGRSFSKEEKERMGAGNVAVLGHSYWRSRFQSNPSVIGSTIRLNGHTFTIIGITSRDFSTNSSLVRQTLFIPVTGIDYIYPDYSKTYLHRRRTGEFTVVARLRPGITLEQAQTAANVQASRMEAAYPDLFKSQRPVLYPEPRTRLEPAAAEFLPPVAITFMILVSLVLLSASANVASLFYARASGRQKELAIRAALGARRREIVQQLLTESLVLSIFGAVVALVFARWATGMISGIRIATDLSFDFQFTVDYAVIGYAMVLAILSGILAGLMPALRMSSTNLVGTLREGGQSSQRGSVRQRLRDALVVVQVAVSLVLLVCAGLFLKSTQNAARQDLAIKTEGRIVMGMDTELAAYDEARTALFYRQVLERTRQLPGVEKAALGRYLPIGFGNGSYEVFIEGKPTQKGKTDRAYFNIVSEDYFDTIGMLILEGRRITTQDVKGSKLVAVINEAMAKRYWPGQNAIGKRFRFREVTQEPVEVVGISRTTKFVLPTEKPSPAFYLPFSQNQRSDMFLHVYSKQNPEQMISAVRSLIRNVDPEMSVYDMRTLADHIRYGKMRLFDIGTGLIAGFGLIALVLTAVGLYGVMAFLVSQRTPEIGLRMALGATQKAVLKSVFANGMKKTLIGLVLGAAFTVLVTRTIGYMLVGVSPKDPTTILSSALFLLIVTAIAVVTPAWRAMRVDPLIALRAE